MIVCSTINILQLGSSQSTRRETLAGVRLWEAYVKLVNYHMQPRR